MYNLGALLLHVQLFCMNDFKNVIITIVWIDALRNLIS